MIYRRVGRTSCMTRNHLSAHSLPPIGQFLTPWLWCSLPCPFLSPPPTPWQASYWRPVPMFFISSLLFRLWCQCPHLWVEDLSPSKWPKHRFRESQFFTVLCLQPCAFKPWHSPLETEYMRLMQLGRTGVSPELSSYYCGIFLSSQSCIGREKLLRCSALDRPSESLLILGVANIAFLACVH